MTKVKKVHRESLSRRSPYPDRNRWPLSGGGQGTTIDILLPVAQVATASEVVVGGQRASLAPALGGLRVLVVDDEPSLAAMLGEWLTLQGAKVRSFNDPAAAIAAFEEDPVAVDLVLSDATMPEFTGIDLAAVLFRYRPTLPVILCTGQGSRVDREQARSAGIFDVLDKPVDFQRLLTVIRNAVSVLSH